MNSQRKPHHEKRYEEVCVNYVFITKQKKSVMMITLEFKGK